MSRILHIVTSPRGARSRSRQIAESFLAEWRRRRPGDPVDTLDLWDEPVPAFGPAHVEAKMAVVGGGTPTGAGVAAWHAIRDVFDRFDAADTYLVGAPMWNGGIPWILKQYIDTVTQPGLLFSFDPASGYRGLLRGKRAVAVYTSAVYSPGVAPPFGRDFHSTYLEDWLRFAGIDEIHAVRLQPSSPSSPGIDDRVAAALADARALAGALAGDVPRPVPPPQGQRDPKYSPGVVPTSRRNAATNALGEA